MKNTFALKLTLLSAAIALSACSSTQNTETVSRISPEELEQRNQQLVEKEKALAKQEAELSEQKRQLALQQNSGSNPPSDDNDEELLPPDAKSGECYARVWVEPTYQSYTESVLVKESSQRIEVIPAKYQTVSETVQEKPASYKIQSIPAKYSTVSERKLVRPASQQWLIDSHPSSAPASNDLLKAAQAHGIDLDAARPGMCFHEHYHPAKYETVKESVLVREAYDVINTSPAEFRWVEKKVLVKEQSSRLEQIPAQYETVSEQVVDVPAHTVWKKGTGPIQKIDEATGEIMCLVEVPATFKTVTKRVLKSPATTKEVVIPAEYKTIRVKELVSEASETKRRVPAKYEDVAVTKMVSDVSFTWHEVHNRDLPARTRTGNKICLTETPAQYETIKKTVVVEDAKTKQIEIPASYKTIQVTKLVSAAQEKRHTIPAEYKTVHLSKINQEGYMEWRSILCETNMTTTTIRDIQNALRDQGYDPGKIDGVVGRKTMKAVNDFQSDNDLPSDKYINIDTVKALGVKL